MTQPEHKLIPVDGGRSSKAIALADRSDDDLMLLARGGRKKAFEMLVHRYQRKALNVAYKKVGDVNLARDIAQNTFIELYRYVPSYKAQGRFPSLLFRILYNQCKQVFRTKGYAEKAHETLTQLPAKMVELPDDQILKREQRLEIERALTKLSDKLRDAVVLRFTAELSYKEISLQLDVPVGTVKSRIAAGMEKLREILEGGK